MNISVIGATGYSGAELMRILSGHPNTKVVHAVSKSFAGKKMSEIYPSFLGCDYPLEPLDIPAICADSDIVFTCLPHGTSSEVVPQLLDGGVKVIDLSGDFRYNDAAVYEKWYNTKHGAAHLLNQSVYGLTELYRDKIKHAGLVGNSGCYTTSSILALAPLLRSGLIDTGSIIIDAKSGVTGAGRSEKLPLIFCEVDENFKAYGVASHRHTSEIEQELSIAAGSEITLSFTPHLLPIKRGILTTIYASTTASKAQIDKAYDIYSNEPFVHITNTLPEIKHVIGSNNCAIGFKLDERTGRIIIISCIDNLIKGAAGQAVQNMNTMCGYSESEGLNNIGWYL
ncbi:MAG: N-acetyl-gamma-glutamyl-phosphate reductase [Clostridia bacterium]|jgi:N-acetyl-gamma-glutamyl-phosphate reductase|nr:N-acetyl-gamma-glutamyl-phosphate reductase [Clostridia bacterium]